MAKRNPKSGVPAPARAAAPSRKRTPRTASAAAAETTTSAQDLRVSEEELQRQISEPAYYQAEQRGFAPGYEHEDWVEAEAEVMRRLGVVRR
jgi:hypothetical protein